jgi:hypothetical protein
VTSGDGRLRIVGNAHGHTTVISMTPAQAGTRGVRKMTEESKTLEESMRLGQGNMMMNPALSMSITETVILSSPAKLHPEVEDNTVTEVRIIQASIPRTTTIAAAQTQATPVSPKELNLVATTAGTVVEVIRVARLARVRLPVADLREGRFRSLLHLLLPQPPVLQNQRARAKARIKARAKGKARQKNATLTKLVRNGRRPDHASTSINVPSHGVNSSMGLILMPQLSKNRPQHRHPPRTLPLLKGEVTIVQLPIDPAVIDVGEVPIETVIAIEAAIVAHKLVGEARGVVATRANVVKESEKLLRRPPGSQ